MTWEEKIESLVKLAKAAGRYINDETERGTDYAEEARRRLLEAYEEFCQWRHDEPYVVDEIKGLMDYQQELLHDYKVFCNRPFDSVSNIMGVDYLNVWKEDRDSLKARANHLLGE